MIHRRDMLRSALLAVLAGGTLRAWAQAEESFRLTLGSEGDAGQRLEIRGRVLDPSGAPIEGAEVRVRHADAMGVYRPANIGVMRTDASGRFILQTRIPGNYGRPRHIHTHVFHDSYMPVYTEILFKGDPVLGESDPPNAILLENTVLQGEQMLLGSFDVVMEPR